LRNFRYCANLAVISGAEPVAEFCKDLEAFMSSFINLLSPGNQEVISTKYPILTWTHSEPFSSLAPGEFFRIIVTEMEEGQKPEAAVISNHPIFFKDYLLTHNIPYPQDAPELTTKKHYAWEVEKISNGIIIQKTEAWEFSLVPPVPIPPHEYVVLNNHSAAGYYYPVDNMLYFCFQEGYEEGDANCLIYDSNGKIIKAKIKSGKNVPEQNQGLKNLGDNRFGLDLKSYHLKKGFYNLMVNNLKGDQFSMRFYMH
jgi:hypothetical protein